jgi:hypothetical protein
MFWVKPASHERKGLPDEFLVHADREIRCLFPRIYLYAGHLADSYVASQQPSQRLTCLVIGLFLGFEGVCVSCVLSKPIVSIEWKAATNERRSFASGHPSIRIHSRVTSALVTGLRLCWFSQITGGDECAFRNC